MAVPQPGVWGIDLGQCALKALRLEIIDGEVTATAFDYVEHPKILSQPDADPDQLTREALEKFLSRNPLRGDIVAMSVPGQSGLARFVKLPPVEEKKITDIVRFEAKQQIPFNLEEVVWDYQKIGSGVVTDGFAMETEIGLFAIKRDMVAKAMEHFQEVEVEINIVQMAPLALCNYVSYDLLKKDASTPSEEDEKAKKPCVVALDIGVETSNLVITDGERIIWQRPIPIGGNRFTRALTKELKLTFAKAEHLKQNATKSPDLRKILLALKPDLNEFVNEVQKSLAFFTNSHRDAQVKYLMGLGGAFRLPGLQKYLGEKLNLEVKKLAKFNRLVGDSVITAPVFTDNVLSFAVAYGLAVQGLKLAKLQTNLLPHEIRTERQIRAKKPLAVAAAAALLIGVASLTWGFKAENEAVASPELKAVMDPENEEGVGGKALQHVIDWDRKCRTEQQKVIDLERQVGRIIAGQDERVNWLALNKFINNCLPRPNGENLTDKQKEEYWKKGGSEDARMTGEEAWKKLEKGQGAISDDGSSDTEEELKHLVQINLEAVASLYTDDLNAYFQRLSEKNKTLFGMVEEEKKAGPKGGGWVVEIRGFTYHNKQHQFLLDTLIDNLNTRRKETASASPATGGKEEPKKTEIEPVKGNISHVVLFVRPDKKPIGHEFELIKESLLMPLVAGVVPVDPNASNAPPPTTPPPPPGRPGAAPPPASKSRAGWKPLGAETQATLIPKGAERIFAQMEVAQPEKVEKVEKGHYTRTEFIVLFVWREPTPSDALKGPPPPATPASPTGQPPARPSFVPPTK